MTQLDHIQREVRELREMVSQLLNSSFLDHHEISLGKAAKMMSCSSARVKRAIERGEIRARRLISGSRVDYRIKIGEIKRFQDNQSKPIKNPKQILEELQNETTR